MPSPPVLVIRCGGVQSLSLDSIDDSERLGVASILNLAWLLTTAREITTYTGINERSSASIQADLQEGSTTADTRHFPSSLRSVTCALSARRKASSRPTLAYQLLFGTEVGVQSS